ncbi:unnamed protein product [Ectocarpus sp. 8 AP-2014]
MLCANKVSRTSCKHQHRRALLFREHAVHEHSLGPTTSMRRISHSEACRCSLLVLSWGRQSGGNHDEGGSKVNTRVPHLRLIGAGKGSVCVSFIDARPSDRDH